MVSAMTFKINEYIGIILEELLTETKVLIDKTPLNALVDRRCKRKYLVDETKINNLQK